MLGPMADDDVTRRTWLAAERTWLAWWRTALGASVAAIAVGRLAPELTEGATWPWVVVGAGYALLAIAMFVAGMKRQRVTEAALAEGGFEHLDRRLADALAGAGVVLSVATFALIVLGS
jgi:putative membrane protein